MKVRLVAETSNPEYVVTLAAATCYSDKIYIDLYEKCRDKEYQKKLITKLLSSCHESPFEHANFTFFIEGISRSTSHQLVRHRIASYSQRSQRYTTMKPEEFNIPESISSDPEKKKAFEEHLDNTFRLYKELIEGGIPKEDARELLPNATQTTLVMTMNLRELRHFMELRLCNRAQSEIQSVAIEIYKILNIYHPLLTIGAGPKCWYGKCTEEHKTDRCPLAKITN